MTSASILYIASAAVIISSIYAFKSSFSWKKQKPADFSVNQMKMMTDRVIGIIIVDHGSRLETANKMLLEISEKYQQYSNFTIIEPAHMELSEPSIPTAYSKCVQRGATHIVCHPYFLSRGKHVLEDIPRLMREASSTFPSTTYAITDPLGTNHEITTIMHSSILQHLS